MKLARALAFAAPLIFTTACDRELWIGPKKEASAPRATSSGPPGTLSVIGRPAGPHPRILLTKERLTQLASMKDKGTPAWKALEEKCEETSKETIAAGYEVWDWGNAALDLALCYKTTKKKAYADAAVKYFAAMLDDRHKVGDKKGGPDVVQHDDGYPIRTHALLGAILYDWLFDAPGMTPELQKRAVDRFVVWTSWFKKKGYNHDQPIANYYAGYFGAVAFAGIATEGEDPRAADLRAETQRMWNDEIVPVYRGKLAGGDFPEGWQYGDLVGAVFALYAEAEVTAHPLPPGSVPKPIHDDLPWLKETVAFHANALLPDGKRCWDTGDWSDKPAVMPPHTLWAVAMMLPPSDPVAKQATFLARLATDPPKEEWHWLRALGDDPSRPAEDPRRAPAPSAIASYLAKGTGTVLARTDFTADAIMVGLSSAPSLSDHQHLDAGHFGIVRGADWLVVDSGGYGSFSGLSHNVIAVDDGKKNLNYSPSQGTWSDTASIARSEDGAGFFYAQAEYVSAYNPAGYPKEKSTRSVTRAERELVFSRAPLGGGGASQSSRVVVYDRIAVLKPAFQSTFLLHGAKTPEIKGAVARIANGKSAAWVTTILPVGALPTIVQEPTNRGDGPFYANDPPEGTKSTRIEVAWPRAATVLERRYLHAIAIGASDTPADKVPPATRLEGEGADGVALDGEAYVFAQTAQTTPAPLTYRAPPSLRRHFVAGLAPGAKYKVVVTKDDAGSCRISIADAANSSGAGAERVAGRGGVFALEVQECSLR